MTKLMYRGYEVRTKDAAKKDVRHEDLIYRGSHYDPADRRVANENKTSSARLVYRGVAAA
mgnify:FL=1|tara:strand:+ start:11800 stop:11979 length:180 start_codon:yes stop_codon:yes gene_type:complete